MMGRSNSLTRFDFPYNASGYLVPSEEVTHGYVRVTIRNGSYQTWAVTRPVSARTSQPYGGLIRGHTPTLVMPRPNREMDPTNPMTWQREYVFSS